jgi:hypothetical protein
MKDRQCFLKQFKDFIATSATETKGADVDFSSPCVPALLFLIEGELCVKYADIEIKPLRKNALPAYKIRDEFCLYKSLCDGRGFPLNDRSWYIYEFQVWEFWGRVRDARDSACLGFIYKDTTPRDEIWQAHGFSGIDTQRCYDLACKMVGLIS